MIRRTFIAEEHEEYGNVGLRPQWIPDAEPFEGMAVAHDILEHFPNDDGSPEHEFMALGASMYVRDDWYFGQKGAFETDPAIHLAAEFPMQYSYACQRGYGLTVRDPGRTCRLEDHYESLMDRMFDAARKNLRSDGYRSARAYLNGEQEQRIRGWFRRGYRRAQKRYRGRAMTGLFIEVERLANGVLKHEDLCGGERVTFMVDPRREWATYEVQRDDY